jgi:hypothetical protein
MLVGDKFIYINLPRCASTSFVISCIKRGISINHVRPKLDNKDFVYNPDMNNEDIADRLVHGHESLVFLEEKFGYNYDVIAVNRNRHERFISMWKHCLDEVYMSGDLHSFHIMKELDENDILFYNSNDVYSISDRDEIDKIITEFINRFGLTADNDYLKRILGVFLLPHSAYHNHNPKIKWFDFNKMSEMEEWVSNKLGIDFKLEKINSSQHFECNLKLTDNFIEKYNKIYDRFDITKSVKTFL